MALIYDPEVVQNDSYSLKIEWADIDSNFTHYVDNELTDVFNASSFAEFMNGYYDNNIRLIDVKINEELYSELFVNIDAYIDWLNSYPDDFSINFLAKSPDEKQKLIIRTTDLYLFPKFFENWSIIPITGHTSKNYQTNLKLLIALQFKGTTCWNFSDYLYFTLVNKKICKDKRFGFSHQPQFRQTIEELKAQHTDFCNYIQLGITNDKLEDWDNICNSFYSWYTRENINTSHSVTLFDEFKMLKDLMSDIELFSIAYQDFEKQNDLFVGLPFDLINRRLTVNI
jgi:hypothetical protein